MTIQNEGAPTFFSIQDRKNQTIHQGITPQQVELDAKAFPFWPAKYSVAFAGGDSTVQQRELKANLDPWVAGNLLLGGGAGAVVDGVTGAMFKLPPAVTGHVPPQLAVTDATHGAAIVTSSTTARPVGAPPIPATSRSPVGLVSGEIVPGTAGHAQTAFAQGSESVTLSDMRP